MYQLTINQMEDIAMAYNFLVSSLLQQGVDLDEIRSMDDIDTNFDPHSHLANECHAFLAIRNTCYAVGRFKDDEFEDDKS